MVCLQCAVLGCCCLFCAVRMGECDLPGQYRRARSGAGSDYCDFHNVDLLDTAIYVSNRRGTKV